MNACRLSLFLFFLLWGQKLTAQTLTGQITDSETNEPLPFVNVFISNTTKGTQTDIKGNFTLHVQASGYVKVVASMVGYKSFEQELVLKPDETRRFTIRLKSDPRFLDEVKVAGKRDKQWKRLYKDFEREFLGRTKNARNCAIKNPYFIDLTRKKQVLYASSSRPLDVENKSLGYTIEYQLEQFNATATAYEFSGKLLYREVPAPNDAQQKAWELARNDAYRGSLHHFLRAVAHKKSRAEGFRVYLDADTASHRITRNRYFKNNQLTEINPDTLAYTDVALQRVILPNYKYEIHYLNRRDPQGWYFDVNREVTWLTIKGAAFAFSYNGILENSYQIETGGSMSKKRIADLLPNDYEPNDSLSSAPLEQEGLIPQFQKQEKFLLRLAQSHYALGDTLHYRLEVIDATTLQPVPKTIAYLAIRNEKGVILQQPLWIDEGKFDGQWIIPNTLKGGTYQLIAYNNWARHFDERFWGRKAFQIITGTDSPPKSDSLQVIFFPESGHLIAGLPNRIGVRSFTKEGAPVIVEGRVTNAAQDTLMTFKTNAQGYGNFFFTPSTDPSVRVKLNTGNEVALPPVHAKGYVIQADVLRDTANVIVRIYNNLSPQEWKPMRLLIHLRGQILYEAIAAPKGPLITARIPKDDLEGTGVMQITLLDALNNPIAGRAFYHSSNEETPFQPPLFESELYACELPDTIPASELTRTAETLLLTHNVRPYGSADASTLEYESGLTFKGTILQANGRPLSNHPVMGLVRTDSTVLHFQATTDLQGNFASPPMAFFDEADVTVQAQSDKVKNVTISLDTTWGPITPQWFWSPVAGLTPSKRDSLSKVSGQRRTSPFSADIALFSKDFRRPYPKADSSLAVSKVMQGFPLLRLLGEFYSRIKTKTDGVYWIQQGETLSSRKAALFIDGLPTSWESLQSLFGHEIETIDILAHYPSPVEADTQGLLNVILKPNSRFWSEQNIKRFKVNGLIK
ncbi:MAG: carboxypeptidase-like regulatory domain-containing protein [Spirosomataceae bacterium]